MRCRYLLIPLLSLLFGTTHSSAQTPVQFSVAAGTLVDPYPYGKHASVSAAFPAPWKTLQLRIDGLLTKQQRQSQESFSSVTANVLYDSRLHPRVPYLVAGVGIAVDASLAFNAGLGWKLPANLQLGSGPNDRRVPLFVEWRAHRVHHDVGFTLGLGAGL